MLDLRVVDEVELAVGECVVELASFVARHGEASFFVRRATVSASALRARARRDMTVPSGIARTSAISR